jgi:outer membrane protein
LKNFTLILNVILVLAVGFLYYLHFSCSSKNCTSSPTVIHPFSVKNTGPLAIAYVNSDTLLKNYEFYKKMKTDFESKQARLEADLTSREQALRTEAASYQQKAATMTENELRSLQEKFGKKEQEIIQFKEKSVRQLTEEQQKQNELLYAKITNYLKANCQHKFKYVLGYAKDGNVLYAEDSLNITKQVIEGLNKEYAAQKK